jgi:hypothetical protein
MEERMLQAVAVLAAGYALYLLWKIGFLLEDVSKAADPIKKAVWGIQHKVDVMEGRMESRAENDPLVNINEKLAEIGLQLTEISASLDKIVNAIDHGAIDEIRCSVKSLDDEVRSINRTLDCWEDGRCEREIQKLTDGP